MTTADDIIVKKPLYEVGQIVMMKGRREMPFKILKRIQEEGFWYYAWDRKNFANESLIRAIEPEEIGRAHLKPEGGMWVSREVIDFLTGVGELDGCSFGDRPPGQGAFWWRKYLHTDALALRLKGRQ